MGVEIEPIVEENELVVCQSFRPLIDEFFYDYYGLGELLARWRFEEVGQPLPTRKGYKAAVWIAARTTRFGEYPVLAAKLPIGSPPSLRQLADNMPPLLMTCFAGFIPSAPVQSPEEQLGEVVWFPLGDYKVVEQLLEPTATIRLHSFNGRY